MIINNENIEFEELSVKILGGINKALRQLVENTAAKDGTLVVGDGKGNPISVPAKELLKQLSEKA